MFRVFFLSLLVIELMTSVIFSKESDNILKPDKSIGRTCSIAANKINIRLKQGYALTDLQKLYQYLGLSVDSRLLEPVQSILNNSSNYLKLLQSDRNIIRIALAEEPLLRTFTVSFTENISPEEYCRKLLKKSAIIEIAEPVVIDESFAYMPNDPKTFQQGLLATCSIFDAWEIWKGDSNMIICISDGGIYQEHEDIIGNIAPNMNEIPNDNIDNDGNGYVDDYIGYNLAYKSDGSNPGRTYHSSDHGTAVSSIAAAATDNSTGMAGVGFKCRIFPLKTARLSGTSISYGYQSIIYAAVRGFKVMNCSWGSAKQFSQIDQSVIDYAVSKGVAIVAAAGNEGGDIVPVYPASYRGVLSVGNVSLDDELSGSSSLGANLDIMAPGESSLVATNEQGGYQIEPNGGTSFASPVVAGVLALVRSKYPELTPEESIAFIKLAVDDIKDKNFNNRELLTGRINALKAVTMNPMSLPGIVYHSHEFSLNGEKTYRIYTGQTVDLKISCSNVLGNANNLRFVLTPAYDFSNTINIIDSVITVSSVLRNESFTLDKFRFSANNDYNGTVILRVNIYGENGFQDFFMISFIPASEVTTLGNNIIKFSAGDRGQIGFAGVSGDEQGIGVVYKNIGNTIYNAGLIVTAEENSKRLVSSSLFGSYPTYNDFISVKPYIAPNKFQGIMNDDGNFSGKIGVEVEQVFNIPPDNINIIAADVTIKNNSVSTYSSIGAGYYFDWDISPDNDSNVVALLPEAIPESFKAVAAAAEYAAYYYEDKSYVCGCASFSNNETNVAAAAGMTYSDIEDFPLLEQFATLNTGASIQNPKMDDVNMVVGMRFPGQISNGESRSFKFYFGCADTKELLAASISNSMLGLSAGGGESEDITEIDLFPVPAYENISINIRNCFDFTRIEICDLLGNMVTEPNIREMNGGNYYLTKDISNLNSGVYFVRILTKGGQFIRSFIKD